MQLPIAPAPQRPDGLVARAQAGDVVAFEQLYREHVGRVYALSLRAVADVARAESLTQDVFVRAWRSLATFRGAAAFSTWLHRIAVHAITDDFRTRRRGPELDNDVDAVVAPLQDRRAVGIDLECAIRGLPEKARIVFVLHDIAGETHDEIAARLDVTPGTCKAQLFRARQLLREVLSK